MGINISNISSFSSGGRQPTFARDANITSLEQDVFKQLIDLLPKETPVTPSNPNNPVQMKHISVEDAIKELEQMEKEGKV